MAENKAVAVTLLEANKSRVIRWAIGLVSATVFLYFLPLFHIVPLDKAKQLASSKTFDAVAFVDNFWNTVLQESTRRAVNVTELYSALRRDPKQAAKQYGHRLGLGGTTAYFVYGQADIVAVNDDALLFSLGDNDSVSFQIELGPVFGNAIRDGSGLLNVSDFSNTRDFNAISSEINRRVEEQVLPQLKSNASVGTTVRFIGGVEVADTEEAPSVLTVVPLDIGFND